MPKVSKRRVRRILIAVFACAAITPASGCIGMFAHALWVGKGDLVPPAFDKMDGKRVAVVCRSEESAFGPDPMARAIAERVGRLLAADDELDITVIPYSDVADWQDNHGEGSFREIGRAVDADMVLGVELLAHSLYEGSTLYKGRADVKMTVHDMHSRGEIVDQWRDPEFSFPANGAYPSTEKSEQRFRHEFVVMLSRRIANRYRHHSPHDAFALDATLISR